MPHLAEKTGIKRNTIYGWIKGPGEPRASDLVAISNETGCSIQWLATGIDGEPQRPDSLEALTSSPDNSVAVARFTVQASAGNGAVVLAEDVADYFRVGRDWLERYVPRGARSGIIEAKGDSMEPTIRDGDILLLNFDIERQDVANGGVFVITIDGNLFVKRLQIMLDGSIMIRSDNDRYEPERVDREYADEKMLVHARVVWSGGPLR